MKEGSLVRYKGVSLIAKVKGEDPADNKRVIIQPLTKGGPFSCAKDHLEEWG